MSKWIHVSEAYPPIDKPVVSIDPYGDFHIVVLIQNPSGGPPLFERLYGDDRPMGFVIYWAPIGPLPDEMQKCIDAGIYTRPKKQP